MLDGWVIFVVSSEQEFELLTCVRVVFTIAGVAPMVSPEDLSHFVHGLSARACNHVVLTFNGKFSFPNNLGKCPEDSDSVIFSEGVKDFVVIEFNFGEELLPAKPPTVELGIYGRRSG